MARRTSTSERARRLIALLGQLKKGTRIPVADLARSVGATPAELTADLVTLSMCGVAPYDPYDSVPVSVEDGFVEVWGEMPAPTGTVRLSIAQAAALAAGLQAAGFAASDPLTAKLLAASSADFDAEDLEHTLRSTIATHDSATYETLALAIRRCVVTEIDYAPASRNTMSVRTIEPVGLFAERGAWYLSAWCRTAGAHRTFRVDRVRDVRLTEEEFVARPDDPGVAGAFDGSGLPVATLRFAANEPFSEREWPGGRVTAESPDGSVVAEVPFGGTAWLARRVVARLGAVEAVAPAEVREAVRQLAIACRTREA